MLRSRLLNPDITLSALHNILGEPTPMEYILALIAPWIPAWASSKTTHCLGFTYLTPSYFNIAKAIQLKSFIASLESATKTSLYLQVIYI